MRDEDTRPLAERLRQALIECATAALDDARLQGLCCEGGWEAAISAMRALDLTAVMAVAAPPSEPVGRED
jgi:hypothetical protein